MHLQYIISRAPAGSAVDNYNYPLPTLDADWGSYQGRN